MRIEEAVECMSKINLHRMPDGYGKDTLKPDEATSRLNMLPPELRVCTGYSNFIDEDSAKISA